MYSGNFNAFNGKVSDIKVLARSAVSPNPPSIAPVSPPVPITSPNMERIQLTKQQYKNDKGFNAIFAELQSGNSNLVGVEPAGVSFETRNGVWIYMVSFKFATSASSFEASFDPISRKVEILSAKSSTFIPAPPVQPSTPGGNVPRTRLTKDQYIKDKGFLTAKDVIFA